MIFPTLSAEVSHVISTRRVDSFLQEFQDLSQNLMQHKAEVDEIILFRLYTDLIFHNYP